MLMSLGIKTGNRSNLNRELKKLRTQDKPLLAQKNFAAHPNEGKLESVHYLTKQGEAFLVEEMGFHPNEIRRPTGTLFFEDYHHRINTIWLQVQLLKEELEGNGTILHWSSYFDKQGSNRTPSKYGASQAQTKIQYQKDRFLIADAVCYWEDFIDSKKKLFALEMYQDKDTKRIIKSLLQHAQAMAAGTLSEQFFKNKEDRKPYQVLAVFNHESTMEAVWSRIRTEYEKELSGFNGYFLFKTIDQLFRGDFSSDWHTLD